MNKKPAPQQKAPAGQWRLADEPLAAALGYFIMAWSGVEAAIEISIAKQLGLTPLDGSIVTAGLQFRGRAMMLLSLLNRDPVKHAGAIKTVTEMQNIQDRNDILHSVIGGTEALIWFNRRRVDQTFKSKIEKYDRPRLLEVTLQCSDLATALMAALDITKEDYAGFFQTAHNEANKL